MSGSGSTAFQRILVPLDGSFLAEQALPFADAISGGAELILFSVAPPPEERRDFAGRVVSSADETEERENAEARKALRRAARVWLGERDRIRIEVVSGDPAEEILRMARVCDADLIVM